MKKQELREQLIEKVFNQIKIDIEDGIEDTIIELLSNCPNRSLIHFLPEDEWEEYKAINED